MKKLSLLFSALLFAISIVNAQDIAKSPRDTIIKDVRYKVYTGSKGGVYALVVSKKTGKEYKKYFKKVKV